MTIKISEIGKNIMWPVGIGVLAFLIRLLYLYQIQENPFFDSPVIAAATMDRRAIEILKGNWIGNQVFYHAPLYEYFLAFLYWVLDRNFFLVKLVQSLIGVASALLIYFIGKKVFNPFTGFIAAMMYSFYGPAILLEAELLYTGLSIFLYLLAVLFLVRFMEDRRISKIFYAGLFVGLGSINRTEVLLFIPVVVCWLALFFGISQKKKGVISTLVFLIGVSIFIIPVTVRNYIVGQDFVLISYKGGIAFYIGNNPHADGMTVYIPGTHSVGEDLEYKIVSQKIAEQNLNRPLKPSEVSNYWFTESVRHIWENPLFSLNLFLKKGYLFWQGHEIGNNIDFYFFREYSWLLKGLIWKEGIAFPFGLLSPLGFIGMYLARKRWRTLFPLYSLILIYMFISVIGISTGRYRIPATPFLMIFGSYSLFYFLQAVKENRNKTIGVFLCCFSVLGFFVNYDFLDLMQISNKNKAIGYFNAGVALEKKADESEAIRMYYKALNIAPEFSSAHHNLGLIHYRKNHFKEAETEFLQAIKFEPTVTKPYILLGKIFVNKKQWHDAVRFSRKGILGKRNSPYMESLAYANLGYAYFNLGDSDLAEESFKKSLNIDPTRTDARLTLGYIYENSGKADLALLEYIEMLRYEPKNKVALYNLAKILDSFGRKREAIQYFQEFLLLPGEKDIDFRERARSRIDELSFQN